MNEYCDDLRRDSDQAGFCRLLGMRTIELRPGYAMIGMTLADTHRGEPAGTYNGAIMALADQAFALATNSVDPHFNYVAIQFAATVHVSPYDGESLIAEAQVTQLGEGRGAANMAVRGEGDRLIASASGIVLAVAK